MPYLGNSGQFSNIYEKNHTTSTLRIIEGSAGYDPVGEDYTLNATLQEVTDIGATTTNTVKFNNTGTSLTTLSRVGIANATPSYKLSIGGAVHMDDAASNVIVANGSAYIESDLVVGNSNLFVDTVNGYIGVNKIAPEYELDVVGDINFTGGIYQNGIEYGGGWRHRHHPNIGLDQRNDGFDRFFQCSRHRECNSFSFLGRRWASF
jgi:hypothetical protein